MLGRSNGDNDAQTSGVLIQYLRDISAHLREVNISRRTAALAAAFSYLQGFLACGTGRRERSFPQVLPWAERSCQSTACRQRNL